MNNSKFINKFILVLSTCLVIGGLSARERIGTPIELGKLDGGKFDANRINTDISNTGFIVDYHPTGHSGMEWPKGSGNYSNFQSGVWFAGKVNDVVRTATAEYSTEFSAGSYGAESSADEFQLYTVNKSDLADPLASDDFQNWPAHRGAPWIDNDGDGVYSPLPNGPDSPDFIGDQVTFYTMNDGDPSSHVLYGTAPLGIEIRVTMWGYDRADEFGDMMFVKMQVFNKGGEDITDMFVGIWDDPDLGDAGDDFVGCDTDLSLGYCYNDGADASYGYEAPALGYDFFQATVPGGEGSAFGFGQTLAGYQSLPMSSFVKYINGDAIYKDPETSDEVYNYMSGLKADGSPFVNSATGQDSKFVHPCNPFDDIGPSDDCWVDGDDNDSADRRFLMNVGPFSFPANDSLEVVFGVLHAQSSSSMNSIRLLKRIDIMAQFAYDSNFNLPNPPEQPDYTLSAFDGEVVIEWENNSEDYSEYIAGNDSYYLFEGYNVWQHDDMTGVGENKLIATYDVINGVTEIYDNVFEDELGVEIYIPVQFGTDSGISRSINLTTDYLNNNSPLLNDRKYYYSVTTYGYNALGVPLTLESSFNIQSIRPHENVYFDVEVDINTDFDVAHTGTANASVSATIVNPIDLTGDTYQVTFNEQHYFMDVDGLWKETAFSDSVGSLGRDVSPSTISAIAYTSPIAGTRDLKFIVDVVSPDYNYASGVKLTFPNEILINSVQASGGIISMISEDGTNSVMFGDTDVDGAGDFSGGEVITVNINTPELPLDVDFTIYDDGWATLWCVDNVAACESYLIGPGFTETVNAVGVVTVSQEAYAFKTINYWNLLNETTGEYLLEDQYTFNGNTLEYITDGMYYVGGEFIGTNDLPITDGFRVNLIGSYDAPENYLGITSLGDGAFDIGSYADYGWAASAKSIDAYGTGVESVDVLQRDVEIVWDGVYGEPLDNGFIPVVEGGSQVWIYDARDGDLATHPSPENPGTGEPFLITVPFKVFDLELANEPTQISIIIYDRIQAAGTGYDGSYDGNEDGVSEYHAFNPYNRMYTEFVNRPYSETLTDFSSNEAFLTWNSVWWESNFVLGDKVTFSYANPLQLGVDSFSFTTTSLSNKTFNCSAVNIWPNPYFADNPEESGNYDNQIHFTDLPADAMISIYNLSGLLVNKIEIVDGQNAIWDARNSYNIPVASGMYIAVITSNGDGCNEIRKIAVVSRLQKLDRY